MNIIKIGILSLTTLFTTGAMVGCKKSYLDRKPSDQESLENVFKTTASARVALNGIHRLMYDVADHDKFGQKSVDLMSDLMSDDMPISGFGANWFAGAYNYYDAANASGTAGYTWTYYFSIINNANLIIANIDNAEGPDADKENIKGQALFYRAYAYYNLSIYYQFSYTWVKKANGLTDSVNFPCLPIYTEPTRIGKARASVASVYQQIIDDLASAASLLAYQGNARTDKSQIDQSVVLGLRARVALAMEDYEAAKQYAHDARQGYAIMTPLQCTEGFNDIKNSEWMWGSIVNTEQTGIFASFLSHMDVDMNGYAALGMQKLCVTTIYNQIGDNDVRKRWWYSRGEVSGTIYKALCQRKFKTKLKGSWAADQSYMRASEMLLIEAEAEARRRGEATAKDLLVELMAQRDPDYVRPAFGGDSLVAAIITQRRIELWGEGMRYADIQRLSSGVTRQGTNHSRQLYGSTGQIVAGDPRFKFRIIQTEMDANPLMIQNF